MLKTKKLKSEIDIAPGCSLKGDPLEENLFVLSGEKSITMLRKVKKKSCKNLVKFKGKENHPFADFKPISHNRLAVLCTTSLFIIFIHNGKTSQILSKTMLNQQLGINRNFFINTFNICSKESKLVAAFHEKKFNGSLKLCLGYFDIEGENTVPKLIAKYDYTLEEKFPGLPIISLNCDFYHSGSPIIISSDMEGERKTEIFTFENERILKLKEFHNNVIGFTSKRKENCLFSIDQFGVISRRIISKYNPDEAHKITPIINLKKRNFQEIQEKNFKDKKMQNPNYVNIIRNRGLIATNMPVIGTNPGFSSITKDLNLEEQTN